MLGIFEDQDAAILSNEDAIRLAWLVPEGQSLDIPKAELDNLKISLESLPEMAHQDSIVWNTVSSPNDVNALMKAVITYQAFNVQAVKISEKIGANDAFRRHIRTSKKEPEEKLKGVIDYERDQIEKIASFSAALSAFLKDIESVFGHRQWTIGSILVLAAAKNGLKGLGYALKHGWELPDNIEQEFLDEVEKHRSVMSVYSERIFKSHNVNLLKYSMIALSGIKRGIYDEGADLHSALRVFGIDEQDDGKFVALASDVRSFFAAYNEIELTMQKAGVSGDSMGGVLSIVLFRRYLITAAKKIGLDWSILVDNLHPKSSVSKLDFVQFIGALDGDVFSAKLISISQDRGQLIENVLLAADQYVYTRQYWMDAAYRVLSADPEIRMIDIKAILDMEPEISANTQMLTDLGIIDRADVDQLEDYLIWMIAVYALPISSYAISKIIESRGDVIKQVLTEPVKVLEIQST